MKNVKMKDIAERANVSIATVSYILNNVKNQTISDETRNKVLEISREFGYVPNLTARSLASKKSGLIGVMIVKDISRNDPWKEILYGKFIHDVERLFAEKGYHIIVASVDPANPEFDIILQRELDGVFLLDIREDMFYEISRNFNVPIIIVDGYFEDTYFHKIVLDFEGAIEKAKKQLDNRHSFLMADRVNNTGIMDRIKKAAGIRDSEIIFVSDEEETKIFAANHRNQKSIVISEHIGLQTARYLNQDDIVVVCTYGCPFLLPSEIRKVTFDEQKSATAVELMISYIHGDFASAESKYTIIKPR